MTNHSLTMAARRLSCGMLVGTLAPMLPAVGYAQPEHSLQEVARLAVENQMLMMATETVSADRSHATVTVSLPGADPVMQCTVEMNMVTQPLPSLAKDWLVDSVHCAPNTIGPRGREAMEVQGFYEYFEFIGLMLAAACLGLMLRWRESVKLRRASRL